MALVDQMIGIAKDLIDQYGDDMTLNKIDIRGYNPQIHQNDQTVTDIPAKGVKDSVNAGEVLEGVIRITDSKITMYAEVDSIDESWTIDGCNIIAINKIGFQDKLVIYDAFVRCS